MDVGKYTYELSWRGEFSLRRERVPKGDAAASPGRLAVVRARRAAGNAVSCGMGKRRQRSRCVLFLAGLASRLDRRGRYVGNQTLF